MKKTIYLAMLAATLFACGTKTETNSTTVTTPNFPTNATGYNLDSTVNIATLQKINESGSAGDTSVAKAAYLDTAIVYDNGKKVPIAENIKMIPFLKSKGVTMHVDKYDAIWETVNNKIDDIGVQNYVFAYETVSFTKGDKKSTITVFQAIAFNKEGKIVKEWDVYDPTSLNEFLK
jgi:hypothetical protein